MSRGVFARRDGRRGREGGLLSSGFATPSYSLEKRKKRDIGTPTVSERRPKKSRPEDTRRGRERGGFLGVVIGRRAPSSQSLSEFQRKKFDARRLLHTN